MDDKISLLSSRETATILRISELTLWRLRKNGEIGFRRIGGRPMFTKSDIQEFIDRSKCDPNPSGNHID